MIVDTALVEATLNTIIDPCSLTAGAPAGLVDMGLARVVSIAPSSRGAIVSILIGTTDPRCLMPAVFMRDAFDRVSVLPGVAEVRIDLDGRTIWTPDLMAPSYAERLAKRRAIRT